MISSSIKKTDCYFQLASHNLFISFRKLTWINMWERFECLATDSWFCFEFEINWLFWQDQCPLFIHRYVDFDCMKIVWFDCLKYVSLHKHWLVKTMPYDVLMLYLYEEHWSKMCTLAHLRRRALDCETLHVIDIFICSPHQILLSPYIAYLYTCLHYWTILLRVHT